MTNLPTRVRRWWYAHPPGFRLRRFRNWFFLGLLYGGYYVCRYNLGIVAPELRQEFKYTNEQYGWISGARDVGYAGGQFINGLFSDGLGGKQAMAVGAIGTIALNLLFGLTSASGLTWMLGAFILIRLLDGYVQAFGAPGMMKVKTAWFERRERGRFSGIFGIMIQLGQIGAGALGKLLLLGFSVPLIGVAIAGLHWRWMFFVPPAILGALLILAWLNVKNHPEETGFTIVHDDQEPPVRGFPVVSSDPRPAGGSGRDGDRPAPKPGDRLPLRQVFRIIMRNPFVWLNGSAYLCTGFVRRGLEAWWVLYLFDVWSADKSSGYYGWMVYLSDLVFGARRSPVAALLYGIETITILGAFLVLGYTSWAGPGVACVFLTLISLTCNSSHSIIGAAVVMDIGGRKTSGFAMGVIDCFQYVGSSLAGIALGRFISPQHFGWNGYFLALLPFSALGAALMLGVWLRTRGRDVRGS
jgi:sugar phosphate permease